MYIKFVKIFIISFYLTLFIIPLMTAFDFEYIDKNHIILVFTLLLFPAIYSISFISSPISKAIKEYSFQEDPEIQNRIEPLLDDLGPNIRVGTYDSDEMNAFAISSISGRKAILAFSTSLIKAMNEKQLMSIAAHELSHIKNKDSANKMYIIAFNEIINFYPEKIIKAIRDYANKNKIISVFFIISITAIVMQEHAENPFKTKIIEYSILLSTLISSPLILRKISEFALAKYSRKIEFRADSEAATMTSKESMISALELFPDAPNHKTRFLDHHPATAERIRRIKNREF